MKKIEELKTLLINKAEEDKKNISKYETKEVSYYQYIFVFIIITIFPTACYYSINCEAIYTFILA